jgi:hypothetical protein
MKFFYAIAILVQLGLAFLERDKNRTAYLLFLWNNLSGQGVQGREHPTKPLRESKYSETKSHASDSEYSLLLER